MSLTEVGASPRYQRSSGEIDLVVAARDGRTGIVRAFQEGSGKLRFPRTSAGPIEAMVLNTSGGLAGGDRFRLAAQAKGGTLVLSTQASERVYRAAGDVAQVRQALSVAAGARLIHAPQPTILFDDAALSRVTRVDAATGASFTFCEGLVLGRAAMGETVRTLGLADRTEIRVGGRLAFVDALRLGTSGLAAAATPAMLGERRAFGLVVHLEADPAALDEALERARQAAGADGGASVVNGLVVTRLLAPAHRALQDALARVLSALTGVSPPRSWQI